MRIQDVKDAIKSDIESRKSAKQNYINLLVSGSTDPYYAHYISTYLIEISVYERVLYWVDQIDMAQTRDNLLMQGYEAIKGYQEESRNLDYLDAADEYIKTIEANYYNGEEL